MQQNDNQLEVEVRDDGVGFDDNRIGGNRSSGGGFGLFNIRERLRNLGGEMQITSVAGRGSRVTISVPDGISMACSGKGKNED